MIIVMKYVHINITLKGHTPAIYKLVSIVGNIMQLSVVEIDFNKRSLIYLVFFYSNDAEYFI